MNDEEINIVEKMMKKKEFTVKDIRNMAGLTQKQMADLLGITEETYFAKEKGYRDFWWHEIKYISTKFKIPADAIVG